jgi:hypothetical protein
MACALACGGASPTSLTGPEGDAAPDAGDANGTTNDGGAMTKDGSRVVDAFGDSNESNDATSTSDANDAASTSDANDAASTGDANDATSTSDASDGAPPACPLVAGAYSVTILDGSGCGATLNANARQCILQAGCAVTFSSTATGNAKVALNGAASLQSDGSFTGAAITEGTLARTGCTGSWDSGTSTMTVDCGLTGSSQSCVLAVQRTGSVCP